jgi:hypothetical protein
MSARRSIRPLAPFVRGMGEKTAEHLLPQSTYQLGVPGLGGTDVSGTDIL